MTEQAKGNSTGVSSTNVASTSVSKVIRADAERLYDAFLTPAALVDWLPPGEMTAAIHVFDARVGGGYRMSLYYPPSEKSSDKPHGKTSEHEDVVTVRFAVLSRPRCIVEKVIFHSDDPAFGGEMTLTINFEKAPGGTLVTLLFENMPPGLRPEDNEAGSRLSLEQLAHWIEG